MLRNASPSKWNADLVIEPDRNQYQSSTTLLIQPSVLVDAYTLRELESQKSKAVQYWSFWVQCAAGAQFLIACILFGDAYWYLSFYGLLMSGIGFYGGRQNKKELILVVCDFFF